MIVLSTDVLRPRLLAMADGASACPSVALVDCAAELAAEPVLMTLTSASTACTTTAGTLKLAGTLRVTATALMSTVGAAKFGGGGSGDGDGGVDGRDDGRGECGGSGEVVEGGEGEGGAKQLYSQEPPSTVLA